MRVSLDLMLFQFGNVRQPDLKFKFGTKNVFAMHKHKL